MDVREINVTLDFCLRVGELLIASGAGAADATATMQSLTRHLGLRGAEIDVTFTSVAMSYHENPDDIPVTANRQVKQRAIDYDHLTQVDHLVRAVLRDDVDLRAARRELGRIVSSGHGRPRWAVTVGVGTMAAAIVVLIGGDLTVALLGGVSAGLIDRVQLFLSRRRIPIFYQQVSGAGLASLLALVAIALPMDIDAAGALTANIIVLLAGMGLVGALQDALTGFYVTAAARLMEVLLSTAGIIAGVSGGLTVADLVGLEVPLISLPAATLEGAARAAFGGALAAAAFAYSSYAPRRILLPIAAIAGVATVISVVLHDIGRTWPVGIAAIFVGLVSFSVAGRMRVPPLVVVVSGVVPFLPGMSIYRGLAFLSDETGANTSEGLLSMFTAVSIAVALASGVIMGEYVAQPLKREARRLETRLTGPRLVGPVQPETRKDQRRAQKKREAEARRAAKRAARSDFKAEAERRRAMRVR